MWVSPRTPAQVKVQGVLEQREAETSTSGVRLTWVETLLFFT